MAEQKIIHLGMEDAYFEKGVYRGTPCIFINAPGVDLAIVFHDDSGEFLISEIQEALYSTPKVSP